MEGDISKATEILFRESMLQMSRAQAWSKVLQREQYPAWKKKLYLFPILKKVKRPQYKTVP